MIIMGIKARHIIVAPIGIIMRTPMRLRPDLGKLGIEGGRWMI